MKEVVKRIISEGTNLKDKYADDIPMKLDYVCIFCQTEEELNKFTEEAVGLGEVGMDTPTGKVYVFEEKYPDDNGTKILKVRTPDVTRKERGDVDFFIEDYDKYKQDLLKPPIAKLIERENMEMVELWDKDFDARVYFSKPPISKDLGVRY